LSRLPRPSLRRTPAIAFSVALFCAGVPLISRYGAARRRAGQRTGTGAANQIARSGLCDGTGAATANGTPVELWTCNGGSNQQWSLS
jgi:hypothetical protein